MADEQFFSLLTTVGQAQLSNAMALNTSVNVVEMAVGDGENGAYYTPTESQTALKNELYRGTLNNKYQHATNANWVVFEFAIPAETDSMTIREAGLFDSNGNMLAIAKLPETYKPALTQGSAKDMLVRFTLQTSNVAQVSLFVDPGTVLATHTKVAGDIAAHAADGNAHVHNHDADYAAINHTHTVSQISDLQSALDISQDLGMSALMEGNLLSTDPAGKKGNAIVDDFKSDTLAIKTGATYEGEGYINAAIGTVDITNPALTIHSGFGYHETGAPEVAFDDVLNVGTGTLNFGASAVGAWIGQNFPTAKDIRKIRFYRDNAAADTTSWLIKFSDDGVTWTTVTTVSGLSVTGWHEIEIPAVGAHTHWIMVVNAIRQDGTNWPVHIPEIEMFEFMAQDMHLQSNAVQLDTADPHDISVYFRVTDTDVVIDGTDRVVSFSIDGGTNFEVASLHSSWNYAAGKRLVRFDAEVFGQTGDQFVWKLETFNSKLQKIEQIGSVPLYF